MYDTNCIFSQYSVILLFYLHHLFYHLVTLLGHFLKFLQTSTLSMQLVVVSSADSMMWYGKYGDNQWYSDACFHVLQAMTSYCWYILNIYCKHIHPLLSLFHYFIVPRKCPIYLFLIITIVTSCKRIVVGTDATN